MDIQKDISSELEFDARLEGANAVLTFNYEGKMGGAKIEGHVSLAVLVDKITDLIPGEWDDTLLDGLAAKFLAKKTGE